MTIASDEIEKDTLNSRYRAYLEKEFAISAIGGRYAPYLIVAAASAFLIPAALSRHWIPAAMIYFLMFLVATRGIAMLRLEYRKHSKIAADWQPVSALLVQANPGLFRAGMLDLPCTVVFSFDKVDYETLNEISERVAALKNSEQTEPGRAEIAKLLAPPAVRRRRKLLPPALTGGKFVYAADLFVNRRYLEKNYLTHRTLPCFAEPEREHGEDWGGLELMPYQITERPAPEPVEPAKTKDMAKWSQ